MASVSVDTIELKEKDDTTPPWQSEDSVEIIFPEDRYLSIDALGDVEFSDENGEVAVFNVFKVGKKLIKKANRG
jgi:hypothetical protein